MPKPSTVLLWMIGIPLGILVMANTLPGLWPLIPFAILGIISEIRRTRTRRQMARELHQLLGGTK